MNQPEGGGATVTALRPDSHTHDHGDCGHSHGHHAHDHGLTDSRRLAIALVVIAGFMVVEIVGGVLSNSLALIADAGHMATDALAIALALGAKWLAKQEPSAALPFGYKRAQVLAAFVNGLGLFVLIGFLIWESVERLSEPPQIGAGLMMTVAILGLAANLVAFKVLHGGDRQDVNMKGALLHVVGDILGSVAAIVSALVIWTTGWLYADPLVTLIVCALIARSAWPLVRETSHVLLQGAPGDREEIEVMQDDLCRNVPGVTEIHHFRFWMVTPQERELSLHVTVDSEAAARPALAAIKARLAERYGVTQSTVQVDVAAGGAHAGCPDKRMMAGT